MPSPTVEEVETRLETVQCAICKGSSFESIDALCNRTESGAASVKCRYSFDLYGYGVLPAHTTDIPYRLKEMSCPTCSHRGVSLNFQVTMSVRIHHFLTCSACQKTFPERSSLEAFE